MKYRLNEPVVELLKLALEHSLPAHVERWQKQVAEGNIDEETRAVCVAAGWITQRDVRVTTSREPKKAVPVETMVHGTNDYPASLEPTNPSQGRGR